MLLVPGSTSFLLLGLTIGVLLALVSKRLRGIALTGLAALAALYWLLSVPVVAELLATRFQSPQPAPLSAADLAGCDAIVVLGAGVVSYSLNGHDASVPDRQTVFNAFEGARLFRLLPKPVPVVASGGVVNSDWQREPESVVIRDLLIRAGVPSERIVLESEARTTHEQALKLAPIIRQHRWGRVVLVAPSVQMPRALAVFAAQGISAIPAEAPFHSDVEGTPRSRWIPSGDALDVSARAAYDYLAWFYYWTRGWLAAPAATSQAPSGSRPR